MPASEPLADAPVAGDERAETDLLASRWKAVARIVAMVAVITIHTAGFNAAADGARSSAGGRLAILFNSTALFSVPMFVMVSGSLLLVPAAIGLSRATMRCVRQNLFFAFLYNVLAIPLAAFGLLNPLIAAAAMALSDVTVIGNALRLRWAKID